MITICGEEISPELLYELIQSNPRIMQDGIIEGHDSLPDHLIFKLIMSARQHTLSKYFNLSKGLQYAIGDVDYPSIFHFKNPDYNIITTLVTKKISESDSGRYAYMHIPPSEGMPEDLLIDALVKTEGQYLARLCDELSAAMLDRLLTDHVLCTYVESPHACIGIIPTGCMTRTVWEHAITAFYCIERIREVLRYCHPTHAEAIEKVITRLKLVKGIPPRKRDLG